VVLPIRKKAPVRLFREGRDMYKTILERSALEKIGKGVETSLDAGRNECVRHARRCSASFSLLRRQTWRRANSLLSISLEGFFRGQREGMPWAS